MSKNIEDTLANYNFNLDQIVQVDTRVFRDFVRFMNVQFPTSKIDKTNYDQLEPQIAKIALINNRNFVNQTDLFIILENNYSFNTNEFKANFDVALEKTMFRQLTYYLDQNVTFKDFITACYEENNISQEMIDDAQKLSIWTKQTLEKIKLELFQIKDNQNLTNKIFQNQMHNFFQRKNEHFLKMLNFQLLVFSNFSKLKILTK